MEVSRLQIEEAVVFKKILELVLMLAISSCSQTGFKSNSQKKDNSSDGKKKELPEEINDDTNDNDSENSKKTIDDEEEPSTTIALEALPKFAMLANDFECGFCHLKIVGSMASTKTVEPARHDSIGTVQGNWFVKGTLNVGANGAQIEVRGLKKENYSGNEAPKEFPIIDFSNAKSKAKGSLEGESEDRSAIKITNTKSGNTVIIGTSSSPITISGDVYIEGDLIIKGPYKGIGTIYVSGNIFIPFDIVATKSPFPYPEGETEAKDGGKSAAEAGAKFDGLALATSKSIIIGNVESPMIGHHDAPINSRAEVDAMEAWFTKEKYQSLYDKAANCTTGEASGDRSLNVVDAFLYAGKSIEGFAKASGFSIRGGVITDYFNILNASNTCVGSTAKNPVHGRIMDSAYIEYDWRLSSGKYKVLERLGEILK
jgi:hypothetical protein